MTRKVRVPIFGTAPVKGVVIDADATQGATIGSNVYNPDGSLFVPAATPAPGQTYPVTVWQRIMYVPPNVVALEKATGTGLFAVTGPATGAFREITAGDGIDVSDGDGVSGDPVVSHADTSTVTDESTSNTGGVFVQNVAFTFDQFGHVTGVTVDSQTVQHNDTTGKQGGTAGEYFHQTAAQNTNSAALSAMGTGIAAKTGTGTWAARSLPNGTGYTWTNPSGIAGNPTLVLSANLQAWSGVTVASKANDSAVMHLTGNETATGNKTFAGRTALQSGSTAGGVIIGANVHGTAITNATRKIARVTMPTYNSSTVNPMLLFGGDASSGERILYVGGWPGATGITAPTVLALCSSPTIDSDTGEIRWRIDNTNLRPQADNVYGLGQASARPNEIFAASATINTSDEREKTPIRDMTPAEIACAIELASLPCVYKWLAAVEEKGDAARLHISPGVQSVIAVMECHGLDPFAYGFVCYDQWEEDGDTPAGDRYSLRPAELAWFVIRGQAARQDALEARIAALEA